MVLKLAMYGTYNSDIRKNFKPVLIIETVLIIMTFRKTLNSWLTDIARTLLEARLFLNFTLNYEKNDKENSNQHLSK